MLNDAASVIYIVLELLIAVLSVLGNVLVCWAVCLNSNLQSITNFFVVSLAVADIAVGVLGIPFAIVISTGFCSNFYGCLFIACFVLVLTQSSIFSLLAIAIDRYIAIKIPLRSVPNCMNITESVLTILNILLLSRCFPLPYTEKEVRPGVSKQLFGGKYYFRFKKSRKYVEMILDPLNNCHFSVPQIDAD